MTFEPGDIFSFSADPGVIYVAQENGTFTAVVVLPYGGIIVNENADFYTTDEMKSLVSGGVIRRFSQRHGGYIND